MSDGSHRYRGRSVGVEVAVVAVASVVLLAGWVWLILHNL